MEDTLWLACGWLMEQTQGGGTGESKGNSVAVSLCSHQMKQGVFCCMRWAWFLLCIGHLSLAMSLMKKKAVEIWLYWVVGLLPISLIYLHLDVCFCSFGSEAVSVLCRLTGKWTALREVAISKQCVFVEVFFCTVPQNSHRSLARDTHCQEDFFSLRLQGSSPLLLMRTLLGWKCWVTLGGLAQSTAKMKLIWNSYTQVSIKAVWLTATGAGYS